MNAYTPHTSARRTDPGTSHEAAQAAASFAGTHCDRIHTALIQCGPMDPEQIGAMVGIEPYSARKRLADLKGAGRAEPTGQIVPTTSGRSQRVWRAL
jgi:predicted ArsR family transcriptional regulator